MYNHTKRTFIKGSRVADPGTLHGYVFEFVEWLVPVPVQALRPKVHSYFFFDRAVMKWYISTIWIFNNIFLLKIFISRIECLGFRFVYFRDFRIRFISRWIRNPVFRRQRYCIFFDNMSLFQYGGQGGDMTEFPSLEFKVGYSTLLFLHGLFLIWLTWCCVGSYHRFLTRFFFTHDNNLTN